MQSIETSDNLTSSKSSTPIRAAGIRDNLCRFVAGPVAGRPQWCWRVLETINMVPESSGCYAIYVGGVLAYIGSSCNLRSRLMQHGFRMVRNRKKSPPRWGDNAALTVKICLSRRYGDWLMREARLIRRLKPRDNKSAREFKSIPPPNDRFLHGVLVTCERTGVTMPHHCVPDAKHLLGVVRIMNKSGCFECRGGKHTITPIIKEATNA